MPQSPRTSARLDAWRDLSSVLSSAALATISLFMSFVVFFQSDAGKLRVVGGDDGHAREFLNRDDALLHTEQVRSHGIEHVDWEIVELDEL